MCNYKKCPFTCIDIISHRSLYASMNQKKVKSEKIVKSLQKDIPHKLSSKVNWDIAQQHFPTIKLS